MWVVRGGMIAEVTERWVWFWRQRRNKVLRHRGRVVKKGCGDIVKALTYNDTLVCSQNKKIQESSQNNKQ